MNFDKNGKLGQKWYIGTKIVICDKNSKLGQTGVKLTKPAENG